MSRTRVLQALASRAGLYVVLLLASALFVLPGLWMVTASLNSNDAVFSYPPRFFPVQWNWENYRTVFEVQPFARQYFNSLYIAVLATAGTVLVSTMAGYALARFRFRGRNGIFLLLISGILIPEEVTVVPLYRIVNSMGLIDTHWPLIVLPIFSGGGVIATFIMRQAFLSLPKEMEDAARLDGLGRWGTYWRVAVPLVRPTVAVVVILSVYNSWNMFLEPLIFLRTPENFTLPLVLTEIEDAYGTQLWNVQMAATTLSILAVLVVFVAAQRHVIAGLTAGSVKG